MEYLSEHVDAILSAIRHSRDLLFRDGGSWETTAWARSKADAVKLAEELREAVFAELDRLGGETEASVGVVQGAGSGTRWGALVRLARR